MKKIIITILVGLFSCQTPLVNKDNITTTKIDTKPNFSGKDCIPYKQGNPPVEKFKHYTNELYDYGEKSPIKKENPYLGEIKVYINPKIVPYGLGGKGDKIEVNLENKSKIDELERDERDIKPTIKVNNKDRFYLYGGIFQIIFNNSCEYEYLKKVVTLYENREDSFDKVFGNGVFYINTDKEKIELEKIENLIKEYNKNYIYDIKEIEFSSIETLKTFILFIKITTQEPVFYKDLEITIDDSWIPGPPGSFDDSKN